MNNGVLIFAYNNEKVDYISQSIFCAERVKKYLNLTTSIVTIDSDYVTQNYNCGIFDKIIEYKPKSISNTRRFSDGSLSSSVANFNNFNRSYAYELSPYDNTLLIDSDLILSNSILKNCFNSNNDIMMYADSLDLAGYRKNTEFSYISDTSAKFYWATALYFTKSNKAKIFFNLVKHVEEHWEHYKKVYQINSSIFRNDFAFSIAAHMLNGFQDSNFVSLLPGKLHYTLDRDLVYKIEDDKISLLIEKENYLGEYTPITTNGLNVHIMNKFSLSRVIRGEILK